MMIDLMIRAESEADFWQVAHMVGLIEVTATEVIPVHGAAIDVLGAIVLPGVVDEHDHVLTPPVVLNGFHVNLRIDPDLLPGWAAVQADWLTRGAPGSQHRAEHSMRYLGVELITGGVATPIRVFAGE